MPIYEYVCADCGERFDRLQRLTDPDPGCPVCGARGVRRAISLIGGLTGLFRCRECRLLGLWLRGRVRLRPQLIVRARVRVRG